MEVPKQAKRSIESITTVSKRRPNVTLRRVKVLNTLDADNLKGADFDESLIQQRNFMDRDEQIAQQIEDLNDLEKKDEEDGVED